MAEFFKEVLRHLGRQLVFGLVDDLVAWIREKLGGLVRRELNQPEGVAALPTPATAIDDVAVTGEGEVVEEAPVPIGPTRC